MVHSALAAGQLWANQLAHSRRSIPAGSSRTCFCVGDTHKLWVKFSGMLHLPGNRPHDPETTDPVLGPDDRHISVLDPPDDMIAKSRHAFLDAQTEQKQLCGAVTLKRRGIVTRGALDLLWLSKYLRAAYCRLAWLCHPYRTAWAQEPHTWFLQPLLLLPWQQSTTPCLKQRERHSKRLKRCGRSERSSGWRATLCSVP